METFSPTLEKSIGIGWVDKETASEGKNLLIRIRNKDFEAQVVKLPFYKRG